MFFEIGAEYLVLEFLFNKVADLKACNFIKKRLQYRCLPVNIAKLLKTAFVYRTSPVAASVNLNLTNIIVTE